MTVLSVPVGVLGTNCYLVFDECTNDAVLVDPACETERIYEICQGKNVLGVVLTHGHFDHVQDAEEVKEHFGCPLYAAEGAKPYFSDFILFSAGGLVNEKRFKPVTVDRYVKDGETLSCGSLSFDARTLCGHTLGDLVLYADGKLIVGDLLFNGSVGRTDFPGGDAEELKKSLSVLLEYPDETLVYSGHDRVTSIGRERKMNPYLHYFELS